MTHHLEFVIDGSSSQTFSDKEAISAEASKLLGQENLPTIDNKFVLEKCLRKHSNTGRKKKTINFSIDKEILYNITLKYINIF